MTGDLRRVRRVPRDPFIAVRYVDLIAVLISSAVLVGVGLAFAAIWDPPKLNRRPV